MGWVQKVGIFKGFQYHWRDWESMREMNMRANRKQFGSKSRKTKEQRMVSKKERQTLPKMAVNQQEMPLASEQGGYH